MQIIDFLGQELSLPTTFGSSTFADNFEKMHRIGEGTYGIVYSAKHKETGHIVAMKRIRMDQETDGLPISSLREISLLKQLKHDNIVQVLDVAVGEPLDQIFLVMEYCEQDMAHLMDTLVARGVKTVYSPAQVKCLFQQLLQGVAYLHQHFIIHRDLKLSNLLLSQGILKIADFGLARRIGDPLPEMTPKVVTLWYRSPDVLLGASHYDTSVDMWAVGCILGEFLTSKPLLPGRNEKDQLGLIFSLLGAPNTSIWPELPTMPYYSSIRFPKIDYDSINDYFKDFSELTRDLIKALLVYRPASRMSAKKALLHPYFEESPKACLPVLLPTFPETRDLKRKR